MAEVSAEYAVQMHGITKSFGSFYALSDMNLDVKKGTIHSILGENGAGKSTLMNVLYGIYQANSGKIFIGGKEINIKNPGVAIENGIGMVHQHFMLVDNFTVTENITLGNEVAKLGVVDKKKARIRIMEAVKKYGLEVDPDAKICDISVGMQQRVEILKALYRGAELLILDEPTAVLTPQEIKELINIMRNLINDGKTIIIITHKLKEIMESSDFCTIIRRGKYIDTIPVKDATEQELASKMVGHEVSLKVSKTPGVPGDVVFEIIDLVVQNDRKLDAVKGLSLFVRKSEILGLAGIDGNGQKELVEAIVCKARATSGTIKINGREVQNTIPRNVVDAGIGVIPDDRHKFGLILNFNVYENAVLKKYRTRKFSPNGFLHAKAIKNFTEKLIEEYDVRPSDCGPKPAAGLSGGNQQKVIIGREVANEPEVLIAVQPTRGLDVGAIENVHKILIRERDAGKAVLLISLELDEVINVSDRIAVIYDGRIQDTFLQEDADENVIGLLMAGGKRNE